MLTNEELDNIEAVYADTGHFPDGEAFIREVRELLKPRFLLQSPHADAIMLEPIAVLDPATNSLTVIDKRTNRPIQFVGELESATWEYIGNGTNGCLRASLTNPPLYQTQHAQWPTQ